MQSEDKGYVIRSKYGSKCSYEGNSKYGYDGRSKYGYEDNPENIRVNFEQQSSEVGSNSKVQKNKIAEKPRGKMSGKLAKEISEKQIEQKLRLAVKAQGGLALKFVSPSTTGVPDRIIFFPGGKVYFVEVKAPGKKMTLKQEKIAKILQGYGHKVRLIDSFEGVAEFIQEALSKL